MPLVVAKLDLGLAHLAFSLTATRVAGNIEPLAGSIPLMAIESLANVVAGGVEGGELPMGLRRNGAVATVVTAGGSNSSVEML